ncbi:hypothetical protein LZ32DRAFT_153008 [Colletotrichum eremochloae]|nr:hypothetical protein LZ32DRAFT_153008 [Colletotrichum eremochloae]
MPFFFFFLLPARPNLCPSFPFFFLFSLTFVLEDVERVEQGGGLGKRERVCRGKFFTDSEPLILEPVYGVTGHVGEPPRAHSFLWGGFCSFLATENCD